MKKFNKIFALLSVGLLSVSAVSCNDDWTAEQFDHFVSFSAPLDNDKGVTILNVPMTRHNEDGTAKIGIGKSVYELPVVVSGSTNETPAYKVNIAVDPDTLDVLNQARYQNRTDLYYHNMQDYADVPATLDIAAGAEVTLLNVGFDFNGIDMGYKWLLPLTIKEGEGYTPNYRKHYRKALLRILPFNDYSGDYSGSTYLTTLTGDEGSGSIVKPYVRGYAVDENTIFFYAGTVDEDRTDRNLYKIKATFEGSKTVGVVKLSAENELIKLEVGKEASYNVSEVPDESLPYLTHQYIMINNIQYTFVDYTSIPGSEVSYTVTGGLTLERKINTQISDPDYKFIWEVKE